VCDGHVRTLSLFSFVLIVYPSLCPVHVYAFLSMSTIDEVGLDSLVLYINVYQYLPTRWSDVERRTHLFDAPAFGVQAELQCYIATRQSLMWHDAALALTCAPSTPSVFPL
jgi:hypothetical protein